MTIYGVFPSTCYVFRRIVLVPSPIVGPMPEPPIVRIIVDDRGCLALPCARVDVPWTATVKLPPLPGRDYRLMVELAQVTCADTFPPGQLFHASVPFTVVAQCRPPCVTASFAPGVGTHCNASISPEHPAELTFLVLPQVALAGLQGDFKLYPPTLKITKLEAIGQAAGMHLNWSQTADGARFVLFAESGAPILPFIEAVVPPGRPVLRVTVEQPDGVGAPEVTLLQTENLLGSDLTGNAVPSCPPPPCAEPARDPMRMAGGALICAGDDACDFNGDGHEDVRDLVGMVHCLRGEGLCPDSVGTKFDCDRDSAFTISDVLCCARHILRRPPCPGCVPDTVGSRPEPGVRARFGEPVVTGSGVDLPLTLSGADRLGAASLTLEAPLDRYEVLGVDVGAIKEWLDLHEVSDGRLKVGLMWMGPIRSALATYGSAARELTITLHLALKAGQSPGGRVAIAQSEFSGPDGAMLSVDLGAPSGMIPGGRLELSGNRPNPFSAETRFTLDLLEAGNVEVGIYDLRGRAVASLFRGPLPAGPHEFQWTGRAADGSVVPNGVYFYRVAVEGKTLGRKLILMRGN